MVSSLNNSKGIAFIIVAIISGLMSITVLSKLFYLKSKSPITTFIFYLHITQIILTITSLPEIYNYSDGVCAFTGWLRTYAQLSNTFIPLIINILIYQTLFNENFNIQKFSLNYHFYGIIFIFYVPLVSLLPFSTNSYGTSINTDWDWCLLEASSHNDTWEVILIFMFAWFSLILTIILTIHTFIKISKFHEIINTQLLQIIGYYPLICIFIWIPRTILRIELFYNNYSQSLVSYYYLNICCLIQGILYNTIYLIQEKSLNEYEKNYMNELNIFKSQSIDNDNYNHSFNSFRESSFAIDLQRMSNNIEDNKDNKDNKDMNTNPIHNKDMNDENDNEDDFDELNI